MTRALVLFALFVPSLALAEDGDRAVDRKDAPVRVAADDAPAPTRSTEMCIDQGIADRLAIKRKRRGAVDRLFVKQGRHELSGGGGYYASDLLSGTTSSAARTRTT